MLKHERTPAEIAADLAAAVAPYTNQLAHDRELRTSLANGIRASLLAGKRARRHTGTSGLVWALVSDPVLKERVAEAIVDVQDAKRRIGRRRRRRLRVVTGLLIFGSIAALAAPLARRAMNGSASGNTSAGGEAR